MTEYTGTALSQAIRDHLPSKRTKHWVRGRVEAPNQCYSPPPPIVYAPGHRSRPHYAAPAIYTHPPKMGPNGIIYSHSAPVPSSHYPLKFSTPYQSPSVAPSSYSTEFEPSVFHALIERLNKLFHDEKELYVRFLACRGTSAQELLDLLQDVGLETSYSETC
jgi:hypothetical protein